MADDIILAHFTCTCGAVLFHVTKPVDQEPGPVTVLVPRSLLLVCRTCLQKQQDDIQTRLALARMNQWPGSSSVN